MEEEDSYSYFSKILLLCSLQPQFAIAPDIYYHNRSFQEYSEQNVYSQAIPGFMCDNLSLSIERAKPRVPKFGEPYKKVKIEDNLTETDVKTEESEDAYAAHYGNSSNSMLEAIDRETGFQYSKLFQTQDTDNISTIKNEEFDMAPLKGSERSETLIMSRKNWGKRDLKKFRKFQELFKMYKEKLNIDSALVSEKFQQISTIAIPKLQSNFKSKPFEAVCAAILLYACREVNYPITLRQIISITDSKDKLINKCVFSLQEILPWDTETKHFKAGEFIKLLTDKLKVNDSVRIAAEKIWENIERLGLMKSAHAMTLAACCVKFACSLSNADKSFDVMAITAETTKTTLKNMYRELFPHRFKFITKDCKLGDPKELKEL